MSPSSNRPARGTPLLVAAPELEYEWHEDNPLPPSAFTHGSPKKATWRCRTCQHVWRAVIATRARGVGCPECAKAVRATNKRKPKPGNSFAERKPELAEGWDYSRNATTPWDHNYGSADHAWFKCKAKGHSFEISLDHYTDPGQCSECRVTARSRWEMEITASIEEAGVPIQSPAPRIRLLGRKRPFQPDIVIPDWQLIIECDGNQWHPDIAADAKLNRELEAVGWRVLRVRAGLPPVSELDLVLVAKNPQVRATVKSLLTHLRSLGFEFQPTGAAPTAQVGDTAHWRRPAVEDSWAAAYPDLVVEWDPSNRRGPAEFTPSSGYRATWRCVYCGNTWVTQIAKRSPSLGCGSCTSLRPRPGESIADLRPDMVAAWAPENAMSPADLRPGNISVTVGWVCPTCGHRWSSTPHLRAVAKHSCNECWRRAAFKHRTPASGKSFLDLYPDESKDWSELNDLKPSDVVSRAHYIATWVCRECGETYELSVGSRANGAAHRACSLRSATRARKRSAPIVA